MLASKAWRAACATEFVVSQRLGSGQVDRFGFIITTTFTSLFPLFLGHYTPSSVSRTGLRWHKRAPSLGYHLGFFSSSAMDMDNMLGGGGGAIGQFPLEQWFYEMPVCTRWWTAATVATSLLVQCHIITPFQLFYSFRAVFVKNQVRYHSVSSLTQVPFYRW